MNENVLSAIIAIISPNRPAIVRVSTKPAAPLKAAAVHYNTTSRKRASRNAEKKKNQGDLYVRAGGRKRTRANAQERRRKRQEREKNEALSGHVKYEVPAAAVAAARITPWVSAEPRFSLSSFLPLPLSLGPLLTLYIPACV